MFRNAAILCFLLVPLVRAADPPPDVDATLRDRIRTFYQLQVDHKFRQAEQLIADDTKDYYYNSAKPDIRSFKIVDIRYASDFQRATVTLSSASQILLPGAGPLVMNRTLISNWKVEEGKWCWYVDQSKLLDTPFGHMHISSGDAKGDIIPKDRMMSVAAVMSGVHAQPTRVALDPSHSDGRAVTVTNTLEGSVTIRNLTDSPLLDVVIAKPTLNAGESTTVTVTPKAGSSDRPSSLTLEVSPTGQKIQIQLDWVSAK